MMSYAIGISGQTLVFTDEVLDHISSYRQTGWFDREAGGQLFAELSTERVTITTATGPRPKDRRSRTSYVPHRPSEQAEIEEMHELGLHYVGDWHTHPEWVASPSRRDKDNMLDCFVKSHHALRAFVMAIAGQLELPRSLHVSLHDGQNMYVLDRVTTFSENSAT